MTSPSESPAIPSLAREDPGEKDLEYIPSAFDDAEMNREWFRVCELSRKDRSVDRMAMWRQRRAEILAERRLASRREETGLIDRRHPARLTVRIPRGLHERVQLVSAHEGVSVNAFAMTALERAVADVEKARLRERQ